METFSIPLSNGASLTGRYRIPSLTNSVSGTTTTSRRSRALVVGLHGGSYDSLYFDVDSNHTASLASDALSIPFVAINRPCYDGPTSFLPIPNGSSFPERYAEWLHLFILPAIWTKFGTPNECTSIVLLCHSLGSTGAIITAAKYAQQSENERQYPLGGIILSGWGSQVSDTPRPPSIFSDSKAKHEMLLPPGTADPSIYAHGERLSRPLPPEEMTLTFPAWMPRWRSEWAPLVKVPVMLAVAEKDALWVGTNEHLRDWMAAFPNSERVDGSFLRGAPHNIEMSLWSRGWYARCFGFAHECAASSGLEK